MLSFSKFRDIAELHSNVQLPGFMSIISCITIITTKKKISLYIFRHNKYIYFINRSPRTSPIYHGINLTKWKLTDIPCKNFGVHETYPPLMTRGSRVILDQVRLVIHIWVPLSQLMQIKAFKGTRLEERDTMVHLIP